jgi:ATP-dependent Clp protease ATP-binding subunit ClpC
MTSNLAADLYGDGAGKIDLVGTTGPPEGPKPTQRQLTARIKVFFAPEFVNRITKIIHFKPLSYEAIRRVARKEIDKVLGRDGIRLRALRVSLSPALEAQIVEQGFDPQYGARPMQRAVEKLVVSPLAAALARGDIADQEALALDWNGVATEIHRH